jgi:hypothetical protein
MMIHGKTPVHNDCDTGRLQVAGYIIVPDSNLHPDQGRFYVENGIEQRRHVLRAPEDVHYVDRSRGSGRTQIRVDRLPQSDAPHRMNGDDRVPCLLKVGCHSMAGPVRLPAQANNSYAARTAKDLGKP